MLKHDRISWACDHLSFDRLGRDHIAHACICHRVFSENGRFLYIRLYVFGWKIMYFPKYMFACMSVCLWICIYFLNCDCKSYERVIGDTRCPLIRFRRHKTVFVEIMNCFAFLFKKNYNLPSVFFTLARWVKYELPSSRPHTASHHYSDVIMGAMASQITNLTIVYSTVYSGGDKKQCSASLAFVQGIQRSPVNSPHKWPVTRKMFPFDDVIMTTKAPRVISGYCLITLWSQNHFKTNISLMLLSEQNSYFRITMLNIVGITYYAWKFIICAGVLRWLKWWHIAWSVPGRYLNQWWLEKQRIHGTNFN